MHIANDVTALIGNTPLVRINRLTPGLRWPKWSPSWSTRIRRHSVKDRIGLSMIEAAEKAGRDQARHDRSSSPPAAIPASAGHGVRRARLQMHPRPCPRP